MRIAVLVSDTLLCRALVDLLRHAGHDVHTQENAVEGSDLRILTAGGPPAPPGCATLLLERGAPRPTDVDPVIALRDAVTTSGQATWPAPLDVRALAGALGGGTPSAAAVDPIVVPDLSSAPHAWLVTDGAVHHVHTANAEAAALLRLPRDPAGTPLDGLPLGPRLRDALREESEGLRTTQIAGRTHQAAWWTAGGGRRIVCFLASLGHEHQADRAARALAELGKMAATLAHEIRNPVASLDGALELLEHESDPDERAEILGMAKERLKQLSRLLEKTLTLARPIEGPTEDVEVQAVMASAVTTLRLDPRYAAVKVSVDAPSATVFVRGYEGPLLQALLNLLLNAAQAQDGVGAIHLSLELDRGRALLRVHDERPVLPPKKRDQVFKPFSTTRADGTGLGLAEVRRALEAFDAEIEILDVEDGACFQLTLPLATGASQPA